MTRPGDQPKKDRKENHAPKGDKPHKPKQDKIKDHNPQEGKPKGDEIKDHKPGEAKPKDGKPREGKARENKPHVDKPPQMRPKKKKTSNEERRGVYEDYIEGHPNLPKMYPLANGKDRKRPEAKREDIRAMKRMFDEGYNAVRLNGAKIRPKMVMINYIFVVLSILKIIGTFSFLVSQFLLLRLPTFKGENASADFNFRVMLNASNLSLAFQVWLILVDGALIQQMFKQDSKSLVWIFGLSSCLTIFVLLLGAFHISSFSNLTTLVSSLIGSYLSSSSHPLTASKTLFSEYECCGFESALDWHSEKIFQWESPITGSNLTLQQNFTWVEECAVSHNREPYSNFICAVPSICPRSNDLAKIISNATGYSRDDLTLLIREEGYIRSTFFKEEVMKKLNGTTGCIPVVVGFLQKQSLGFIIGILIMVVVLPIQTFLISIVFVNDNAFGRLVKNDGVAIMDKLEKFKALSIFKRWDISMGVQNGDKQIMWTSGED